MTSFLYIFDPSYDFCPTGITLCASFFKKTSTEILSLPLKFYSNFSKGKHFSHLGKSLVNIKDLYVYALVWEKKETCI